MKDEAKLVGHATKEMPGIDGGRFKNKRGSVVNGYTLGKLLEEETSGAMSPSSLLPSRRRRYESSLTNNGK